VFFVALALLFLGMFAEKKRLLHAALTGAMLGMAFLMKQQAVYFIVMGGVVLIGLQLLEKPLDFKKILVNAGIFTAGVFIPYFLIVLLMLASGSFDQFWFWTVEYAGKYAEGQSWALGKLSLGENWGAIWKEQWPIWAAAFAGIALLWATKFTRQQRLLATALLVFGALATTPSFYFRQHYFVVALPAVALLAAIALDVAGRSLARFTKIAWLNVALPIVGWAAMLLLISSASKFQFYYAAPDPAKLCKAIYGANPFVESLVIADYLQKNTSENDKIAILGSEPQIPFYAQRHSATGHIYFYPLMEDQAFNQKMQEEMIAEIERNKPKYFVYVNIGTSLGRTPKSPMRIFDWAEKYISLQYNQVGVIEVADKGESQFFWDAAAARHMPQGQSVVYVFRRR
jgi:4-amino-4-deoxy-L-arabinose transferase-like glycosyltransferase